MTASVDVEFIDNQKRYLMRLRARLLTSTAQAQSEERQLNDASAGIATDREEDAQRMAALEIDGNVVVHDAKRLTQVNRALEKISDGSYGLSDISGRPIPRERLEAIPEATCTIAEERNAAIGP